MGSFRVPVKIVDANGEKASDIGFLAIDGGKIVTAEDAKNFIHGQFQGFDNCGQPLHAEVIGTVEERSLNQMSPLPTPLRRITGNE